MARPCQAGVATDDCRPMGLLSPRPNGDWQKGLTLKKKKSYNGVINGQELSQIIGLTLVDLRLEDQVARNPLHRWLVGASLGWPWTCYAWPRRKQFGRTTFAASIEELFPFVHVLNMKLDFHCWGSKNNCNCSLVTIILLTSINDDVYIRNILLIVALRCQCVPSVWPGSPAVFSGLKLGCVMRLVF